MSDNLWIIIQLCWAHDFNDRPDMKKVLDHMKEVNFGVEIWAVEDYHDN
jgi:hypothetical protein